MILDSKAYLASRFAFAGMAAQSETGIQFDAEAARALVTRIEAEMKEIADGVEPKLPPRKLKKSEEKDVTLPAKPFKKDGTMSATLEKFFEKHGVTEVIPGSGPLTFRWIDASWQTVEAGKVLPDTKPMTLGNQDDLKDWLLTPQPTEEAKGLYTNIVWREE